MTDDAARQAAKDVVRAMHYDGTNYYFIWSLDGTGIVHGGNRALEGKTYLNNSPGRRR